MPQTTPDILAAAIKCFHLNNEQLLPEFVVIHSQRAALFAVTSRSSQKLREASTMLTDWKICLDLGPRYQLQLMGIALPPNNDLLPASASTFADIHNQPPPQPEQVTDPLNGNDPCKSSLKFSSPPEEQTNASSPENL